MNITIVTADKSNHFNARFSNVSGLVYKDLELHP